MLLYDLFEEGSLFGRPLGGLLSMFEQGYALVLKEGVVAMVEDVTEVLPICLILRH